MRVYNIPMTAFFYIAAIAIWATLQIGVTALLFYVAWTIYTERDHARTEALNESIESADMLLTELTKRNIELFYRFIDK